MRVRLLCNGTESAVSPFINRYVCNIGSAIAASLKVPPTFKRLELYLNADSVSLRVDDTEIHLDDGRGFAKTIVRDTIRGMIKHLKNLDPDGNIHIEICSEEQFSPEPPALIR